MTFNHVALSEPDCVCLGDALQRSAATTHLYLRNNTLTFAGLLALARALETNTSLYSLALMDNNVGGDGLHAILRALRRHPASPLRQLSIDNSCAINAATGQRAWPRVVTAPIYTLLSQVPLDGHFIDSS